MGGLFPTPEIIDHPHTDNLYFEAVRELEGGLSKHAQELVAEMVKREPASERTAILRSQVLEAENQLDKAANLLEEFVKKNLQSPHARGNLARLQWRLGEPEKALGTLRFALAQQPNQERTLHFYAAIMEEKNGFRVAYRSLMDFAKNPEAWVPPWVAAVLSNAKGEQELSAQALLTAARNSPQRFPPNPDTLLSLLQDQPTEQQKELWQALRPHCRPEAKAAGDNLFSGTTQAPKTSPRTSLGRIKGGTSAHPLLGNSPAVAVIPPVRMIKPENWQAEAIAGPLSRGFSLLLAELFAFKFGVCVESVIPCSPEGGVYFSNQSPQVEELRDMAGPDTQHIYSAYLSRGSDNMFALDCERYDRKGNYLGHLTEKSEQPSLCAEAMATRLVSDLGKKKHDLPNWQPNLELESLLARDTAASFLLCESGSLTLSCLPNPGLSLDLLAGHSAESQNTIDLWSYWNALVAAEQLGVPSAKEQRETVEELLQKSPELSEIIRQRPR